MKHSVKRFWILILMLCACTISSSCGIPQTPATDSIAGSISPVVSIEPEPEATASASPKQTEESIESLIAKLDDKNDLLVRYKAIEKLGQIGGDKAVEALLGSMKDAQFEIRYRSMEALVKIGTDDVTDALSELCNDGDADVRLRAAEALGRIGGNKAEGLLVPFLSDTDSTVRYYAALRLANSKNNQAESVLIKALTDTLQYDYRESIIDALVSYGDESAADALSAAVHKLSDSEEINYCVLALGRIGSQSSVPALTKLLETHVADSACTALGEIGGEKAEKALEKHLFGMFIINADSSLVIALAKIGGERAEKALREALSKADIEEHELNINIALMTMGDKTATDYIISMAQTGSEDDRKKAMDALSENNIGAASEALMAILQNQSDTVEMRGYAGIALGKMGCAGATDILISMIQNRSEGYEGDILYCSATEALGELRAQSAVEPLIKILSGNISGTVEIYAERALAKIGGERAVNWLIDNGADPSILVQTGDSRAVDAVLNAAQSEEAMVRYGSLEALAEIGTDRALDLLTAALLDKDTNVRRRAISVISGGFYYGNPTEALGERQLEAVISAVQDEDEETGLTAANVLCCRDLSGFGRVEEAKISATEELAPMITDADAGKRKTVARKLVILGGEGASDALLKAINDNDLAVVAGGCSFYLQNLNKSWEPIIVSALEQYGDLTMASACLNSGSNVLEKAARNWAAEHNVQVLG